MPSKEEIEKAIGEALPDNTPILEVKSLPSPEEQLAKGIVFRAASKINEIWKVFLATKLGSVVAVYLLLITLGAPFPKPFEIIYYSSSKFVEICPKIYQYLDSPNEPAEKYLVSLPESFPETIKNPPIYDLPPGSGVFPVSGSYLA